jgi:phosphoribosylformylglycinamidine synthase
VLNIKNEINLQKTILKAIKSKLIKSAHDISEGGLAVCLAEKAIGSGLGCEIKLKENTVGRIFGESQSRVVVSFDNKSAVEFEKLCSDNDVPCEIIGKVSKGNYKIEGFISISVDEIKKMYESAIPNLMNK